MKITKQFHLKNLNMNTWNKPWWPWNYIFCTGQYSTNSTFKDTFCSNTMPTYYNLIMKFFLSSCMDFIDQSYIYILFILVKKHVKVCGLYLLKYEDVSNLSVWKLRKLLITLFSVFFYNNAFHYNIIISSREQSYIN